jgi:hypothetical protein
VSLTIDLWRCCGLAPNGTARPLRDAAGAESEPPFTTDEVAALLNVPADTINEWHKEGSGPPGYQKHKESHCRRADVIRWLAEQGGIAGYLPERLRWDLQAKCVHDG